jgi:K+:H+ antiporter subunit KhtU
MAERLLELGAILIGLAAIARIANRFGIATIPFYLLAGLAFGKGGLLPLVTTQAFIHTGSEIGLILLLFMLGLEHSASDLLHALKRTARAGVVDVVLNFAPGFAAGFILGWGVIPALFLGGVTLVSSSGIAAKMLGDLGLTGTPEARFVISIAVIEDLAMAVFLPVLGVLAVGGATFGGFASAFGVVAGVIVLLLIALRVEVGVSRVIFSHSDEALLLTILGVAILVAGLAELVQVSAAVGALLAGIVLSGPAAKGARQLLTPLRDLFAALFFAFIGFSVDPSSLTSVMVPAFALAAAGVVTKLATGRFGGEMAGIPPAAGMRAGLILVARGEFSIAIAGLAVAAGLEERLAPLAVAYVLIMAVIGPLAARSDSIARRLRHRVRD